MYRKTIVVLSGAILCAVIASLHFGVRTYSPVQVVQGILDQGATLDSLVILTLRIPRTLIAIVVGAGLATAGLIMQVIFRNPLAEPGLLGVNAGASFAVLVAFTFLGVRSLYVLSVFALLGAFMVMGIIYALMVVTRGGMTPAALILTGVTLSVFFSASTQTLLVLNEETIEALLFWLAGGFADRDISLLWNLGPMIVVCILAVVYYNSTLSVLVAGEKIAHGLGVNILAFRALFLLLACLISAFSVVIAGPVGFIGLVAPHFARQIKGLQTIHLLVVTLLIGACLGVVSDIIARVLMPPQEVPITAILSCVGGGILIFIMGNKKANMRL